ncbi:helix-turn-helix transcriptional regulator [Allokutzneria sp. NRRL B-24872]|uniref:helix-turn-helix domain-containing protein n=1 Tax=Allokutzneria sp. NRRL B-24872 TaxID=1137961 RepID=UPI00143D64C1|nr:helix-turn-helix transcriptional regulator [Allokutzneria sp. NRRL B-24872]
MANPARQRRKLALRLKELREAAGLTHDEANQRMGWARGKLTRIENESQRVLPDEIDDMLSAYGHTEERERQELKRIAKETRQRGWWQQPHSTIPVKVKPLIANEAAASLIRVFDNKIPGQLQTADYARAVIRGFRPKIEEQELERRVASRLKRRLPLDEHPPQELVVILDEAALRRPIGGSATMQEQVRHLIEMAERPNITIQVVPESVGAYPGLGGWFCILTFPDDDVPDMAYTDGIGGSVYLQAENDVETCNLTFNELNDFALSVPESIKLMQAAIERLS